MGLTKPRAYQIFDIDYKQAVRVITLTNVTLSGGAPSTVDGVSLGLGSRILVAGQSTGSQNGVYQVSVLGTGSNGTWIRSVDTNESGELNAGTIVMVTEGTEYKDTQWKLTTNDPITIGVTALVFEQNSAFAFGNIYANSTAVLADIVGDTVTFTPANNMVILGNATSDTVTFAVSQSPSFTGNVSGGNISTAGQVTAAANVTGANLITTGLGSFGTTVSATGNVTGGNLTSNANISGSNLYLSSLTANRVVFANTNGQLITTQNFTYDGVTANIQGALIVDNVELDSNSVSSTVGNLSLETPAGSFVSIPGNILISGDITGNLLPSANITYNLGSPTRRWNDIYLANSTIYLGNSQISANATSLILTTPQGSQVAFSGTTANISAGTITATGNANVGNLGTAGQITATGNITGGNLTTAGRVDATGNITGGNLNTGAQVVATGNVSGGNLTTAGLISATGNITGGNVAGTTGAFTNVSGTLTTAAQTNITSVGTLGSLAVTGNTTSGNFIGTLNGSGANVTAISATNISSGTLTQARLANAAVTLGSTPLTLGATVTTVAGLTRVTSTEFVGVLIGSALFAGTVTTAAQPNITSVGTLTSVTVTGNVSGGNLTTAGQIVATGNITANNFIGNLSGTANVANFIFATESPDDNVTYNIPYLSPSGVANAPRSVFSDATGITFNPSTNILTVSVGNITTINATTITVGTLNATTAIDLADNDILRFGTGDDWELFHDGTTNRMDLTVGDLVIRDDGTVGDPVRFTFGRTTGLFTATGNVTGGNLITAGLISATGNVTGGNLNTGAQVVATGNVTGGNLTTAGSVDATGNITGGNINANTAVDLADNVELRFGSSDDVEFYFTGLFNIFATDFANTVQEWDIFGNNGSTLAARFYPQSGDFQAIGNITGANVISSALVSASTVTATGNVTGGNLVTAGLISATGNITGGNVISNALVSASTVTATGNVTGGNLSGTLLTGTLTTAAQPNVTSVGTLTSLTATGNVSGGNLVTTGTVTTGTLTASGNVTVAGNLTVSGNVISINVTDLNVVDPIIGLGRGANDTPLTTNDGKDRGEQLWYYTTSEQSAFIGYDNSAGKLIAATNVTIASEVVTVNAYGNLVIGGLESTTISATGNANVGNLGATTVTATTLTGTIGTAAQTNITSVGTLGSLAVTGNVTSGNFVGTLNGSGANVSSISADNISSGTLAQARLANAAVTLGSTALTLGATVTTVAGLTSVTSTTFVGALTGAATTAGTVTTAAQPNITSVGTLTSLSVTGNVTSGNVSGTRGAFTNVAGNLETAAQPNITSVGTLTSLGVTGNITSGNLSGTLITGTLTTAAQPNISSLGTLTSLTVSGNVTGGNLNTGAQVVATGNITGGNLITSGVLSVTGNANVGNLGTAGLIIATGNITGSNLTTGAQVVATGNVTGGNLVTTGQLVATGNVTGALIKASSNVEIQNRGILFLNDSDNSNYIGLRSPATLTGNFTYIFPSGYGNAAQVLTTNGAGGLTWEDQSGGGGGSGATSFPNSTVQPVPGSTGNFDLSYNFVQTVQEIPFESSATDPFGVNLGEVYSMMDPVGEVLEAVDLGVLT